MSEQAAPEFILPPALVTRADLARMVREVENLDNELEAQKARGLASGTNGYRLPTMSSSLSDFLELNKLDVADDKQRMELKERLRVFKDHAPILHMTFAVSADPESLQKLIAWTREQIHPQALLSVGLQPALVGGVYLRTPNHVHDFTLRQLLAGKRDIIVKELEGLG